MSCGQFVVSVTLMPALHNVVFCVLLISPLSIQINALRATINRLACEGPGGTWHLSPDKISRLQEECQECLIRSLKFTHTNQ